MADPSGARLRYLAHDLIDTKSRDLADVERVAEDNIAEAIRYRGTELAASI